MNKANQIFNINKTLTIVNLNNFELFIKKISIWQKSLLVLEKQQHFVVWIFYIFIITGLQ